MIVKGQSSRRCSSVSASLLHNTQRVSARLRSPAIQNRYNGDTELGYPLH